MKILVVGAGAVGSLVGALLAQAGHELTLVRLDAPRAEKAPLTLIRPDGARLKLTTRLLPAVPSRREPGGDPDLIIFGVKMYTLDEAIKSCRGWTKAPVMTIENGIGAEETVLARRPSSGSIAASLTASVEVSPAGEIRQLARGGIALAPVQGRTEELVETLAADFRKVGMDADVQTDAASMKWSKLLANMVGNATSAILDMDPAEIYGDAALYRVERGQMLEALAVMRALGRKTVALPGAPVPWLARAYKMPGQLGRPILANVVGGARGGKLPSLRLAVHKGEKPTEVAWLNGAVARLGAGAGVKTPINAKLAVLVDEVAADPIRSGWFDRRPDRLLDELSKR